MNEIIEFENNDNIMIDLLDSVPSDKLHEVFQDKRFEKYRGLYSNILDQDDFSHTFDVMEEVSVDEIKLNIKFLGKFTSSTSLNGETNSFSYLEDYMESFDKYTKDLGDGIDKNILDTFKDELKYLNYKGLNKFRRGLLLISKIK